MSILTPYLNKVIAKIVSQKSSESLLNATVKIANTYKINSAPDDTAALANHTRMASAIRSLGSAIKNASDVISLAQTADSALSEISKVLLELKELTVKASNQDLDGVVRSNLSTQAWHLFDAIDEIAHETHFHNTKLLDGSFAAQTFQVGFNPDETLTFDSIGRFDTTSLGSDWFLSEDLFASENVKNASNRFTSINAIDLSNSESALFSKGVLLDAFKQVNATRTKLIVLVNQCDEAIARQSSSMMYLSSAKSRIFDADYAQVTSQLAKSLITQNAVSAMLGHANHNTSSVLRLLKP